MSNVNIGYEFVDFQVSNATGSVTANFMTGTSEWSETADMLVGADGVDSLVRAQLFDGQINSCFDSACVMSGITRIHIPPTDVPDEFPNGTEIPDLSKQDVYDFCPEGVAKSVVGGGVAFGCVALGNGLIGWNLVAAQDEPGIKKDIDPQENMCNPWSWARPAKHFLKLFVPILVNQ